MVFLGYMPSSGIAGSYGSSIFSFLSKIYIILNTCNNNNVLMVMFPEFSDSAVFFYDSWVAH